MSKLISYASRITSPGRHYSKNLHGPYEVNAVEEVVENNRIVKKSIMKTVNPVDNFKGIKVSDFYLSNLEAIGALENLKSGKISLSALDAADMFDAQVNKVDNFIQDNLNDGGNE